MSSNTTELYCRVCNIIRWFNIVGRDNFCHTCHQKNTGIPIKTEAKAKAKK